MRCKWKWNYYFFAPLSRSFIINHNWMMVERFYKIQNKLCSPPTNTPLLMLLKSFLTFIRQKKDEMKKIKNRYQSALPPTTTTPSRSLVKFPLFYWVSYENISLVLFFSQRCVAAKNGISFFFLSPLSNIEVCKHGDGSEDKMLWGKKILLRKWMNSTIWQIESRKSLLLSLEDVEFLCQIEWIDDINLRLGRAMRKRIEIIFWYVNFSSVLSSFTSKS